jgi:hypothetical protein
MKTSTTIKHLSAAYSTTSLNLIKYHNFTTKQGTNTKINHLVKKNTKSSHRETYIKKPHSSTRYGYLTKQVHAFIPHEKP